jgi:aspartate/methionine/tyrosine aminotransferase
MEIAPFELERYFGKYEFSARYLLSSSDCESLSLAELLSMADAEMRDSWEQLKLGYTDSWGHPLLREEIASIYQGVDQHDVLVVVPEEGIFLLMHALLEAGDHVVCTFPGYQSLYEVARSIGCEVSTWQPDESRGWYFSIEDLGELIRANTKLVVVNFPHNPTGFVPTRNEFIDLVELVRDRGAYLLSDEMYRFLEVEPGTTLPAACELYERAFSLFGLSKSFGLPGLRIGWLASQDHQGLNEISKLKDYSTICSSAPSEILAIIALRNKTSIIDQQIERVRKNVAVLDIFFDKYQDHFSWNRPTGGSICFPRMLQVENTRTFCEQLVVDAGIMLAPSSVFQYGDHHVRIGFGRENLPQVIRLFGKYFEPTLWPMSFWNWGTQNSPSCLLGKAAPVHDRCRRLKFQADFCYKIS